MHNTLHIPALLAAGIFMLSACAPLGERREIERAAYDLDYDVVVRIDEVAATRPDLPPLDGGDDCNANGIEDAFDYAGFVPRGPYPVGDSPQYLAAGTVSGGTRPDLLVVNRNAGTLSVLPQRHDRRFTSGSEHIVGAHPSAIAIADFDGDGLTDVLIGHDATVESFTMLRNLPGGGFVREELPLSAEPFLVRAPRGVAIANLDGGPLDVIGSSGEAPGNRMLTLLSSGAVDAPEHKQMPLQNPGAIVVTDFDADGDPDVCAIATMELQVSCAVNALDRDPPRRLADWEHWTFATGMRPHALAAADVDADGRPDLVIAGSNGVSLLRNTGGTWGRCTAFDEERGRCTAGVAEMFAAPERFDLGGSSHGVSVADLDDDGDLDIAATLPGEDTVAFLINRGGSFLTARGNPRVLRLPVRSGPYGILAQDIDRDGRVEVAVTNRNSDDVWVLHRRGSPVNMMLECLPMLQLQERRLPEGQ